MSEDVRDTTITPLSKDRQAAPVLTPQQKRLRSEGALQTYRRLMVGDGSPLSLLGLEFYQLCIAPLPGLPGYAGRAGLLPFLINAFGAKSRFGRSITIRGPKGLNIGRQVFVDDYSVLDVRRDSQKPGTITLDDYVFLGRNTIIAAKGAAIRLHQGVNVSSHCRIASETSVEIGESTLIAAYVYIGPGNHSRDPEGKLLADEVMELRGGVKIGKNCWIGTRATILDGVTIGDNAVVGAHSLVREDVPPGATVAGTPARIIRS